MIQCPKCNTYVTEKEFIKTDVRYAPGNIAVEYNAQCPHCRVEVGRISWGQLTINPDLEQKLAEERKAAAAEAVPQPEPEAPLPRGKVCPHCGKSLPIDF